MGASTYVSIVSFLVEWPQQSSLLLCLSVLHGRHLFYPLLLTHLLSLLYPDRNLFSILLAFSSLLLHPV